MFSLRRTSLEIIALELLIFGSLCLIELRNIFGELRDILKILINGR